MKSILHRAKTRGHANYGWLDTHHTFSFARYYDPARMQFGALRVLNDDVVEPGKGFSTHAHDNMEIISIPLAGALAHRDSAGHEEIIKRGDVQVMSAGSGITHSEYNASLTEQVNFLQIWALPKEQNIKPRYEQKTFHQGDRVNKLQAVVSPDNEDSLRIHQDAWFFLSNMKKGFETEYQLQRKGDGVYLFVLEGSVAVANEKLNRRDGLGIWETDNMKIIAESNTEILLIEVPMQF